MVALHFPTRSARISGEPRAGRAAPGVSRSGFSPGFGGGFTPAAAGRGGVPPFAVTKTAPPPAARAESEERGLREGSREPSPVRNEGREGGKPDQGLAADRVGASRGSAREGRGRRSRS